MSILKTPRVPDSGFKKDDGARALLRCNLILPQMAASDYLLLSRRQHGQNKRETCELLPLVEKRPSNDLIGPADASAKIITQPQTCSLITFERTGTEMQKYSQVEVNYRRS
jgi:hypothetical protein